MHARLRRGVLGIAMASALAAGGIGTAVAADTPAAPGKEQAGAPSEQFAAKSITRDEVIKRAQKWSKNPVPYSMEKYKDGYRTDCSGYVSLAYKLGESYSTVNLPNVVEPIKKDELKSGDIIGYLGPGSGGANGHVVIFEKWADKEHTKYYTYEQTPPHTMHHVVKYPYKDKKNFKPYRYKNIK